MSFIVILLQSYGYYEEGYWGADKVKFQGYYNTGWFNPEMRSRAVFWFCQQTISKVDFK